MKKYKYSEHTWVIRYDEDDNVRKSTGTIPNIDSYIISRNLDRRIYYIRRPDIFTLMTDWISQKSVLMTVPPMNIVEFEERIP